MITSVSIMIDTINGNFLLINNFKANIRKVINAKKKCIIKTPNSPLPQGLFRSGGTETSLINIKDINKYAINIISINAHFSTKLFTCSIFVELSLSCIVCLLSPQLLPLTVCS